MEVVNEKSAYLSNFEVLDTLKSIKANKQIKAGTGLATVAYETIKYLQETACQTQTPKKLQNFLKSIEPFKLTKFEKLMIVNTAPKSLVEIQCIVDESETRLSEEEVNDLLHVIETTIGNQLPDESSSDKQCH